MLRGGLFTRYFLEDGTREMPRCCGLGAGEVQAFAQAMRAHWADLEEMPHPSEAETEAEFIFAVLGLLGWSIDERTG